MHYLKLCSFPFLIILLFSCNRNENKLPSGKHAADSNLQNKNPYIDPDLSPLDMSWCPANYPVDKMQGNDSLRLIARLVYSRPFKKGRQIFGDTAQSLCPYGKPWRLGANEATEITLFENVSIEGKNIPKGTYVMYCIPYPDRWMIIFNSNIYTWGLHINAAKDIFKAEVPVMKQLPALEQFTMVFQNTATGADLLMGWDNVKAVLPFTFAK